MKLTAILSGEEDRFEGDHALLLQALPEGALVSAARLTLEPVAGDGGKLLEETIRFTGDVGDPGATKRAMPASSQSAKDGFVEIDFHGRRTLDSLVGKGIGSDTRLAVDLGGVWVPVDARGAVKTSPDGGDFPMANDGPLPALTVAKLRLVGPGVPDVTSVTLRSGPSNVTVRVGDQPPFWTRLGEVTRRETSPDFGAMLQAYLIRAKVADGVYQVPFVVHSDTLARVRVTVEVEFLRRRRLLPEGLAEVTLTYDHGGVPQAGQGLVGVALPDGARAVAEATSGLVVGRFEPTRVSRGELDQRSGVGVVPITPDTAQAQPFGPVLEVTATAVDLRLAASTSHARLALSVNADNGGKPSNQQLAGPVTLDLDRAVQGAPTWVAVPLPAEFHFRTGVQYWIEVQSLDGEASWIVDEAAAGELGMHHSVEGALAWRQTSAGTVAAVAGMFRLRNVPPTFRMPVELKVGADGTTQGLKAQRVKLDRFAPLGRMELPLNIPELAGAVNAALGSSGPAACPPGEHIANADLQAWTRVGDTLGTPQLLDVMASTLAVSPDGRWVYAGVPGAPPAVAILDPLCGDVMASLPLSEGMAERIVFATDSTRAYVVTAGHRLEIIDTATASTIGRPIDLRTGRVGGMVMSADGAGLYVAAESTSGEGTGTEVRVFDPAALERSAFAAAPPEGTTVIALSGQPVGMGITTAPDGSPVLAVVVLPGLPDTEGNVIVVDVGPTPKVRSFPQRDSGKQGFLEAGSPPVGLAFLPDGRRLLVASGNPGEMWVFDAVTGRRLATLSIQTTPNMTATIQAFVLAPDGGRAFIASPDGVRAVDVESLTPSQPTAAIGLDASALVVTPRVDRVFVCGQQSTPIRGVTSVPASSTAGAAVASGSTAPPSMAMVIPVGSPLPSDWTLSAGSVVPAFIGQETLVAALGQGAGPSSLLQVVPAGPCPFALSFLAAARRAGATAQIAWLDVAGSALRTDEVAVSVLPGLRRSSATSICPQLAVAVGDEGTQPVELSLHRQSLTAPAGVARAEVRFQVPAGNLIALGQVSLAGTTTSPLTVQSPASGLLTNPDLHILQAGVPAGWTISPASVRGVARLTPAGDRTVLANPGAQTVTVSQRLDVAPSQPWALELSASGTAGDPHVEVAWLDATGVPVGAPVIQQPSRLTFAPQRSEGSVPAGAARAEVRIVLPPGTSIEVEQVMFRSAALIDVPVTFLGHAPGELTITGAFLAYDVAVPAPLSTPAKGLSRPGGLASPTPGSGPAAGGPGEKGPPLPPPEPADTSDEEAAEAAAEAAAQAAAEAADDAAEAAATAALVEPAAGAPALTAESEPASSEAAPTPKPPGRIRRIGRRLAGLFVGQPQKS